MVDYKKLSRRLSDEEMEAILNHVRESKKLREAFPLSHEQQEKLRVIGQENWEQRLDDMGYSC